MKKGKKVVLGIILVCLILFIAFLAGVPFMVLNPMLNKHVDFNQVWNAEDFGLEAKHFFVETEDGLNISSYEVKVKDPKGVIVCISGIDNPSVTAYYGHAKLFKENKYASILFDMRGHGKSDGDKIYMGYKEYLDTQALVKYIKKNPTYKDKPIIVMGLSMGAATAINSIGQTPEIDGLISLSSYSSFEKVFYENMSNELPETIAKLDMPFVHLATFIKSDFHSNIKPKNEIKKLGQRPALLVHSREDSQISFSNFEELIKNAPKQVESLTIEGDKHMILDDFTKPEDNKEYQDRLIGFLEENFSSQK